MDNIAGPSNASSTVFATHIINTTSASSTGTSSYYSNIEPDFKWMKSSVKYLIQLVSNHFDEFYDKTVKKKILWKKIAEEMKVAGFKCTFDECDKKWRNIKKTYVSVLQKQVQGDFSSKFAYFDEMHAFLGKEIDPLGMREQGLNKAIQQNTLPSNVELPKVPFFECNEDDHFMWSDSAVYTLIDTILDHEKIFHINSDINSVWESIQSKMNREGYDVVQTQCQRKWRNLKQGFQHHQAEAEISGIFPKWNYFPRVRKVINTFNVPVTVTEESYLAAPNLKGSLTTPLIMRESPHKKRKRKREFLEKLPQESENDDDEYDLEDASRHFQLSLRRLHETLKADDRLSHLEARIEVAHKARAETKQSITLLENILSKLRHINRSFEIRKQLLRDQDEAEAEAAERLRSEGLILNPMEDSTCRPPAAAFLNMNMNMDLSNLGFLKTPKVEMVDANDENIYIVNG